VYGLSAIGRVRVRQFLDHRNYPHPYRLPVQIPGAMHLHGREDRRVLAMLVDQDLEHYPTRWNRLTGIILRRG